MHRLQQEISKNVRYDYLEQHFTEYVQQREEYRAQLQKMHNERSAVSSLLVGGSGGSMSRTPSSPELGGTASTTATAATAATPFRHVSRETQTWKGIICSFCSKTHQITSHRQFKDFVECQQHAAVCIPLQTYAELERRFADLKEAIRVREAVYENRAERAELISARAALRQAQAQLQHVLRKNQHGQFCLETLQRIVWKQAAAAGDAVAPAGGGGGGATAEMLTLTAQERQWIERIVHKCTETGGQLSSGGGVVAASASHCTIGDGDQATAATLSPSALDFTRPNFLELGTSRPLSSDTDF